MVVKPIKTRIFKEGEDLFAFVCEYCPEIQEGTVLIVTSKIAALAEGRTAPKGDEKSKDELIKKESDRAIRTKYVWLTERDGMVLASAGIDESNANGKLILLPKDSFASASALREKLIKKFGLKKLGVLLTDSRLVPLRAGVTAVAMGYAGFKGLKSYVGEPDIFGRPFVFEKVNVADSLATAAAITMGEGNEQQPLAIIEDAPAEFCDTVDRNESRINLADDVYRPFFDALPPQS